MNRALIVLAALLAIAGCGDRPTAETPAVPQWTDEPPISSPWLRTRLPDGVIAYARVPHPLGLMSMPKGTMLDAALGSEANIRSVIDIRNGLRTNVLDIYPALDDPRFALFIEHLASPLEIAAIGPPSPAALIGATLNFASTADLEEALAALATVEPYVRLAGPIDDQGIGELVGLPLQALLKFDAATGQLLILAGPTVTRPWFDQVIEMMPAGEEHPMHALEDRMDSSGHGLFAWLDMQSVMPLAQAFGPPQAMDPIQQAGLGSLRALAVGMGAANGAGRLSVMLDIGNDPGRTLPVVANTVAATAVGAPNAAFLLSIPSVEEYRRLEALILSRLPAESAVEWREAQTRFTETVGVSIDELLGALGSEAILLMDQAGDYAALRVRDEALFAQVIQRVADHFSEPVSERSVNGRTIYEWQPPSLLEMQDVDFAKAEGPLELFGRTRNRWYWLREGEYLYLSTLPQPLMTRAGGSVEMTNVGDWLADSQRVDWSSSQLAATGAIPKLPRRMYYFYIEMMQGLADLTGVDYDVWSMPPANALALPGAGTIGASLNFGDPYVALELTYESMPGEFLLGAGGLGSVAAAGVLAAVAIPAYQDYVMRANVAASLAQAEALKAQVASYYGSTGRFPDEAEAEVLEPGMVLPPLESISVKPQSGVIIVAFDASTALAGGQVWLEPTPTAAGALQWSCSGSIEPKYLPSACR